jgi:hypothetical protein
VAYLQALKAVSAKASSMGLATKFASAAKLIAPVLQSQYGQNMSSMKFLDDIRTEQNRTIGFISYRRAQVADLLKQNGIK